MTRTPINPNEVDWAGENPGISLREGENGPFTCHVSFFRVVYSPHGPGHAVVVLWNPNEADANNGLFTDNPPLALWLRDNFVAYFGSFKGNPLLSELPVREITRCERSGDTRHSYSELITGPDLNMTLTWAGLQTPFMVEFPAEKSATGIHEMFSLFIPADSAEVVLNGKRAAGKPAPRDVQGKASSSAFLALAEVWVRLK